MGSRFVFRLRLGLLELRLLHPGQPIQDTAAAAGNANGPPDKEQRHQQNHQLQSQDGVQRHPAPRQQGQINRCTQRRPQGSEGSGLLIVRLQRGGLRLRFSDLGQGPGKARHPHHMDRIVPGGAVFSGAGNGQHIVALLQGGVRLGNTHGLAVLGGGGKGELGGLIGDIHGIFRDIGCKGRSQLPLGGSQIRQIRIAAEGRRGVWLAGNGNGIAAGGAVGGGDGEDHRVDAHGQLVAADGYIGAAVRRTVIQRQAGHIIGHGDAVFRCAGGKGRRQGVTPAGKAGQIGVAGRGRGHAGRPGGIVEILVTIAVAGHDIGDGGADLGPGSHAGLHPERDGQNGGAAADGVVERLVIGQQVAAAHVHGPAVTDELAGAGEGQGTAVVVQHSGDALDIGAADGKGDGDAVADPDAAGAGEAGPGGLRCHRQQTPQQQCCQKARQGR